MATRICSTNNMSREEWLDIRRSGIGGSDAATCVDMNPWSDKLTLWCDKKGLLPEKEDNFYMKIGRDLEGLVAQYFMEETGKKVRQDNSVWKSDSHPYMIANIDRTVVGENAALECKTMNAFASYDLESGEIPQQYYCQCQHYMAVMGYSHMYIAFIQFGKGFYWHQIDRNDEDIAALEYAEGQFWRSYVEPNVRPAADGSESSLKTLADLHPQDDGGVVALSKVEDDLVTHYFEIKAAMDRFKKQKEECEAKLKSFMGNNSVAESDKYTITWKTQTSTRLDSKKVKELYPSVYTECSNVSKSRVFRSKENKKKEEK